jgi:hypothetical protein
MKHLLFTFIIAALASCSPAHSDDRTLTMPHRIEAWGHQSTLPAGWEPMTMPESDVTLEKIRTDPKALIPLGLYGRSDAQAVFTITVRPAFSDGTLSNWLGWFCEQEDIKPDAIETTQLSSGLKAAVCNATRRSPRRRCACAWPAWKMVATATCSWHWHPLITGTKPRPIATKSSPTGSSCIPQAVRWPLVNLSPCPLCKLLSTNLALDSSSASRSWS